MPSFNCAAVDLLYERNLYTRSNGVLSTRKIEICNICFCATGQTIPANRSCWFRLGRENREDN